MKKNKKSVLFLFAFFLLLILPSASLAKNATADIVVNKLQFFEGQTGRAEERYDVKKYGDVSFTLYKLDEEKIKEYEKTAEEKDNLKAIAYQAKKAPEMFGAEKLEEKMLDDDAKCVFSGVENSGTYLILETKVPKTVVGESEPLLLRLPVASPDGSGILDTVSVTAKNTVRPLSLNFQKKAKNLSGDVFPLEGALFKVYRKDGTLLLDGLKTGKDGRISFEELTVGDYFLAESPVEGLVDDCKEKDDNGGKYLVPRNGRGDENNKLSFSVTRDGEIITRDNFRNFINYEKPSFTSEVMAEDVGGFGKRVTVKNLASFAGNIGDFDDFVVDITVPENLSLEKDSFSADFDYEILSWEKSSGKVKVKNNEKLKENKIFFTYGVSVPPGKSGDVKTVFHYKNGDYERVIDTKVSLLAPEAPSSGKQKDKTQTGDLSKNPAKMVGIGLAAAAIVLCVAGIVVSERKKKKENKKENTK